ncbi:MAG: sulfite exporter TauE/SafE family protein [Candidatus Omnitrophica bacterium]|nr:sulfite exporter TauE/SafE family protein [Candidatus Omnitrophota bacterium]
MILQPILAGLSMGFFCVAYCFPFLTPYLVAQKRNTLQSSMVILKFMAGRFLGYVAFGFLFGYLGEEISHPWIPLISGLSLVILSGILLFYLAGILKQEKTGCLSVTFQGIRDPATMGFFMGVNVCPPFLISLTYIVSLHSMAQGVLYFVLFFLASSLYFLPLIFAGMLSQIRLFQHVARWSGLMVSILFFIHGIYSIVNNLSFLR